MAKHGYALEPHAKIVTQRRLRWIAGVKRGDPVHVRSNGTSVELLATINKRLKPGVARMAEEHARDLHPTVEVSK